MNSSDGVGQRIRLRLSSFFICILLACLSGKACAGVVEKAKPVSPAQFKVVVEKAKALAAANFQASDPLPEALQKIGYDQWRGIRFKSARSLWQDQPFSVQFFHPGFLYLSPVIVHYVERNAVATVPFSQDLFNYSKENADLSVLQLPDRGFAGFRVHYPLNTPTYADELISFLGASYFRALGKGLAYGLSARGLAVNTAEDSGEEFPYFREFWIMKPAPAAKQITVYALLDSQSVTGAYEFTVTPGDETQVKVICQLFIRKHIQKLGVAPLTSMFFFGENNAFRGDGDFRPEVHDSDGLLVAASTGEWIWHPLVNSSRLLVNAFGGDQPAGFGLMQRDINFDHYQDLEARYEIRPSVWVSRQGDWGKGHIELVQIPSDNEYNDNIVAYWVPERAFVPGDSVRFDYTLSWHSAKQKLSPRSEVTSSRVIRKPNEVMFLVDFSAVDMKPGAEGKQFKPDLWVSRGARISAFELMKNPVSGGWRLVMHVQLDPAGLLDGVLPNQKPAIEFRAFLKDGEQPVTETWSYTYLP